MSGRARVSRSVIEPAADNDDAETRGRTRKAPNAFRTISEVADDLHIPQHVLRFWETKFPQVQLLYVQGYTIKGVQRLLREGGGQLSDDIPPPTPDEKAEADSLDIAKLQDVQLPMPGLIPLEVVPASRPPRTKPETVKPARNDSAEAELARLRSLLRETLEELEAIRALLA
jgi:DNA-binding transcriptional MerR regulator